MQTTNNYRELVEYLGSDNLILQDAARMILLAMQEQAVRPLAEQLQKGVTDEQGIAVIKLVSEIGGKTAVSLLKNIYKNGEQRPVLQLCAAECLARYHIRHIKPTHRVKLIAFIMHASQELNQKKD